MNLLQLKLQTVFTTLLSSQGDKEDVLTHWMMDPNQAKMCLVHSVDSSLIPGKLLFYFY